MYKVSLTHSLELMVVDDLKSLLAHLPAVKKPTRKKEIVALIQSFLLGDYLKTLWEQLDQTQKLAVGETLYNYAGEFNADRFKAKYGELPKLVYEEKSLYGFGYNEQLTILRLFMYPQDRYGGGSFTIPSDLQSKLKAFTPQPKSMSIESLDTLPNMIGECEITWLDTQDQSMLDLLKVLRLTEQGKISVSNKTFLASKATINKVSEVLGNGEYYTAEDVDSFGQAISPIKGFAWPLLIQAANLVELKGSKLVLKQAGLKALSAQPADSIKLIWQRWLKTKLIDEFSRITQIKGQKRKSGKTLTNVFNRRQVIAEALKQCPVGKWVALEEFSRFMQSENYFFEVTHNPWDLYICDPEYGSLGYAGYHDWNILQLRYLSCLLFEYAATLGLIDVAYIHPENAERDFQNMWGTDDLCYLSRYDGLRYFRVTELGAYCFGIASSFANKQVKSQVKVSVLPNLHIQTRGELTLTQAQLLEIYTDKISEQQRRFNPDKMIEALEKGHDIAELEKFLSEADEQVLPESVESLLTRTVKRAQSLKVKKATLLIECVDAQTAQKIAQHKDTKNLCLLAGEKHLVLTSTEKAFRTALRKLGYGMPLV